MAKITQCDVLGKLIDEGVKISESKDNQVYLLSSFKRIIKGWKSDIEK